MKTSRSQTGPLGERIYYKLAEIETICSDALASVDLLPTSPEPVRIDRFFEKKFNISPDYKDLGAGILGMAVFSHTGLQNVIISSQLDADTSIAGNRRLRSTLAHEAGHGLLHGHLFALGSQGLLFDRSDSPGPKILCRDVPDSPDQRRYRGEWWEYQANRAIGSLLLPRSLVKMAVEKFLVMIGELKVTHSLEQRTTAVKEVSNIFDVNPVVAEIRCAELFPATLSQLSL